MGKKEMSTAHMNKVVQFVLESCVDGKPKRGTLQEAQTKFSLSRKTIWRLWDAAKKQKEKGEVNHIVSGKKNRKSNKVLTLDLDMLKSIPYIKRGTIRSLAVGLGNSKTTVGRWVQKGDIRAHTSAIKPELTTPNKLHRMKFSLEALEIDRVLNKIKFMDMYNTIHIDEKWFYITKGTHRFYLAPEEEEPQRHCKSKKFIGKVMFMCAVGRPLYGRDGEVLFDGKIGIFPFTFQEPAKRRSKNRIAGTLITKPIESITKKVIKDCLITKPTVTVRQSRISDLPFNAIIIDHTLHNNLRTFIVPTNHTCHYGEVARGSKQRYIHSTRQCQTHIKDTGMDFKAAATQNGFNMHLVQQPPNSPDCNVNDLGWFRAIRSLQVQTAGKTMDDLLNAVVSSFEDLTAVTLNNVFLSLQGCMHEILKVRGQNCYTIPHMGKGALIRSNMLPISLEVPMELARDCMSYLKEMGVIEEIVEIGHNLQIEGY